MNGKYRTSMDQGDIVSIPGQLRLLSTDDQLTQRVEVWLLNELVNGNNWQFLNIEEHRTMFAGTPLLCAYVGNRIGDGHNFSVQQRIDGETEYDYRGATAERIVGYFPTPEDIKVVTRDNVKWLVGTGVIFSWYNSQLVEKIKKRGQLSVSIEANVTEKHMDGNVEVYTKYTILGTTILNENVSPAVAGANIRALQKCGCDGVKELTLRVASLQNGNTITQHDDKKPQNKKNSKGVNSMKIKDFELAYPEYRVLAANGNNVALMSKADDTAYLTTCEKDGENYLRGKMTEVDFDSLTVALASEDSSVTVDVKKILETCQTRCNELSAALKNETDARTNAETKLRELQAKQIASQKKLVIDSVRTRFAQLNKSRAAIEQFDMAVCESIIKDAESDKYTELYNEKGEFIGDAVACRDLDSACMTKQLEKDISRQQKLATNSLWSSLEGGYAGQSGNDIDSMLENFINDK